MGYIRITIHISHPFFFKHRAYERNIAAGAKEFVDIASKGWDLEINYQILPEQVYDTLWNPQMVHILVQQWS